MKKYIFGIGTGRCGTMSLSRILSAQNNCKVTHEFGNKYILDWKFNTNDFNTIINELETYKQSTIGTVAFYIINYIDYLIAHFGESNTKIVVLRRDKLETIHSYYNWTEKPKLRNHWSAKNYKQSIYEENKWDKAYPKYNCSDKKLCISKYYDDYYEIVDAMTDKYRNIIKYMDTYSLSNDLNLKDLLLWCGFENPNLNVRTLNNKSNR